MNLSSAGNVALVTGMMRACSILLACGCFASLLCAACGGSARGGCEADESERTREQVRQYEHSYQPSSPEERAAVRNALRNERKDADQDGFPDDVDACPTEPEDHKAPDPNDGCPAPR